MSRKSVARKQAGPVKVTGKILKNDGDTAVVMFSNGDTCLYHRNDEPKKEFIREFPVSGIVEANAVTVQDTHVVNEHGVMMEQFIAERVLGRPLKAGETIQHANGNTLDNRTKNLLVCFGDKQTPLDEIGSDS